MKNELRLVSTRKSSRATTPNFETMSRHDLPNGRKGKHHKMLRQALEDLQQLVDGRAIKIPLAHFPDFGVADLRSAIHRAIAKQGLSVATSSDDEFLYVWKSTQNPAR